MAKKVLTISEQAALITDEQLPKWTIGKEIPDSMKIRLAESYVQALANKAATKIERKTKLAEIADSHGELPKWLINKIMIEGEEKCLSLIESVKAKA